MALLHDVFDPNSTIQRLCTKFLNSTGEPVTERWTEAQVVIRQNTDKPPLHALIIGINRYEANSHLVGAVPDALAFKKYLTHQLSVPEEHINIMLDEQAKRANVIKAFQDLANVDNGIRKDDPIVIYYAGHGGEVSPPSERGLNGSLVQCIITQDVSKTNGVVPIPDFTIGALVHRISQEKGDNITLIFDCCHSASGSRDQDLVGARFVDKKELPSLAPSIDWDIIRGARSTSRDFVEPQSLGLSFPGMDSHILLAACGHGEVAFEDRKERRGYFSMALLKLLESVRVDSLTYKGCMQRLPELRTRRAQNPVCEGKHINRIIFNARVPGASTSFIAINSSPNEIHLLAGLVHGITPRSKFAIHANDVLGPDNPSLGTLEVEKVEPFIAHLKNGEQLGLAALAYGRQVAYGSEQALDICVTEQFVEAAKPSSKWARLFSGGQEQFVLRPTDENLARVVLSVDSNREAVFTLTNQTSIKYGVHTLPAPGSSPIPPEAPHVAPILGALARWNWHLHHIPDVRPFQKSIDVEFYKLQFVGDYTDQDSPIFVPVGNNLVVNEEVDIVVSDQDCYGLNIVNRSMTDLYAYSLSFSATKLTIKQKTVPITGSLHQDPTLPRHSALTIGYGSSGHLPFMYGLSRHQSIDLNFLKIFVSTHPTDFRSIEQVSPFGSKSVVSESTVKDLFRRKPVWDVFELKIIQRRWPVEQAVGPEYV